MFVNIQHTGESPSERSDPDNPRRISNWPDHNPNGRRPCGKFAPGQAARHTGPPCHIPVIW
jgi:secreted PhoX family phosphatase